MNHEITKLDSKRMARNLIDNYYLCLEAGQTAWAVKELDSLIILAELLREQVKETN